jgi:hypothetical protein
VQGYVSIGQNWPAVRGAAERSCRADPVWVLIGFLIFIYMLIVKPGGVLTVAYQLQPARSSQAT